MQKLRQRPARWYVNYFCECLHECDETFFAQFKWHSLDFTLVLGCLLDKLFADKHVVLTRFDAKNVNECAFKLRLRQVAASCSITLNAIGGASFAHVAAVLVKYLGEVLLHGRGRRCDR